MNAQANLKPNGAEPKKVIK